MSEFVPEFTASAQFTGGGSGPLVYTALPATGVAAVVFPFFKGDPGPMGPSGGSGKCLLIELTSGMVTAKQVTLPSTPTSSVLLGIVNGTEQRQNVDFIVTGTTLSWVGLALELLVAEGDCFAISYV